MERKPWAEEGAPAAAARRPRASEQRQAVELRQPAQPAQPKLAAATGVPLLQLPDGVLDLVLGCISPKTLHILSLVRSADALSLCEFWKASCLGPCRRLAPGQAGQAPICSKIPCAMQVELRWSLGSSPVAYLAAKCSSWSHSALKQ